MKKLFESKFQFLKILNIFLNVWKYAYREKAELGLKKKND